MSKLNSNNISYNEDDFLISLNENTVLNNQVSEEQLILNRAQDEASQEIEKARQKAAKIVEEAQLDAQNKAQQIVEEAQKQAKELVEEAQKQANNLIEEANIKKNELLSTTQQEIERASQEGANKGYEEGYQDAQNKFFEENEEKIKAFEEFCSYQNVVRDKILKNASREILNIIQNISRVILLKEINSERLDKIIKNTISLFDKKENITIILSEKYARLLFELQNKDKEFNFEDFKQYQGFSVIYNKELPDDTIIVENPKERFCASIESQLDKIIRTIMDNTQNGNVDVEEYEKTSGTE